MTQEVSLGKTVLTENLHGTGFLSLSSFCASCRRGRGTWGAGGHPPATAAFACGPWPGLEPQAGTVLPASPSWLCCPELPRKREFCFHFPFERSSMNYLPHSVIRDVIAVVWTNSGSVCEMSCRYARRLEAVIDAKVYIAT